jgi:hypothetical protein
MRIDIPFFDKVIQNVGFLLAAALAIFVLGRTTSHFSNVLNRFLKPLPKVLTDNVHRVLLVICALYVCSLAVWWIWNLDF